MCMPIDRNIGMHIRCRPMTYEELINHFGSQKAAGEALGAFGESEKVSQPSVSDWKAKGIPHARQAQYEILTGGKLRADRIEAKAA